jgi:hypothetical protein
MKVTRKQWAECPVFFIGSEGLIDGETCPCEGEGQVLDGAVK